MNLFDKCTPGQVKRISSIMIDSIPTDLPKKLTDDLIKNSLRSLLNDLWLTEQKNFRSSLKEDFKWVTSFHVKLDEKFSFTNYKRKESSKELFSEFFSQDLTGSEKYPRAIHDTKQANIVRVARATTLNNFFLFVGLTPGYLAGRDGLIQTFEQGSNKISGILKRNEELISPSQHYLSTMLRKTSDNEDFFIEMGPAGPELGQEIILREGELLLYFTDVAWINTF